MVVVVLVMPLIMLVLLSCTANSSDSFAAAAAAAALALSVSACNRRASSTESELIAEALPRLIREPTPLQLPFSLNPFT